MKIQKKRIIVTAMTMLLLCFFVMTPAIGADNSPKLNIIKNSGIDQIVGVSGLKIVDGEDTNKVVSLEESQNLSKVYDDGKKSTYSNDQNTYIVDEKDEPKTDNNSILDSLNPLNVGKKMVGEGGIYFLELLGDAGFKVGVNGTSDTVNIKKNYGQAVALIYTLATIEFDPSQNAFIKEMQLRFGLIGFFLILLFVLLGGASINIYSITSAKNAKKAYILSNRYHIPINEYALTLVESCLMMTGGYVILRLTVMMELMFTKLIMLQILDRIAPTDSNVIMYLMMSLCYLIIGVAIAYRILVIGLFHATFIVFIGLYCFGITRPTAVAAFMYYLKMLFLRPIIVGVTAAGVGIISFIGVPQNTSGTEALDLLSNFIIQPIMYSALVLILVVICIMFILGVTTVINASRIMVKRYTYGAYRP